MSKISKFSEKAKQQINKVHKLTSQGGRRVKLSSMNKGKKRGYKKRRGQGR